MKAGRILYRTRQLWNALHTAPPQQGLEQVRSFLPPGLYDLYTRLSPSEQFHSLAVFKKLIERGEKQPDLLAAALLHDVGKSRFPLNVWERVLIVLGKALFPDLFNRWGSAPGPGLETLETRLPWILKKPFQVAVCHPIWGAQMAKLAGASPLTVSLIRRHQEKLAHPTASAEEGLLAALQSVDDES